MISRMNYNNFNDANDAVTFPHAPTSSQICILFHDHILTNLMTVISASAILCFNAN